MRERSVERANLTIIMMTTRKDNRRSNGMRQASERARLRVLQSSSPSQ